MTNNKTNSTLVPSSIYTTLQMKITKRILGVLFIALVITCVYNYPKLNIISGFAAKSISSATFITHRDTTFTDTTDLSFFPIALAHEKIDTPNQYGTATVYGLMERKAIHRPGIGCALLPKDFDGEILYTKPNRTLIAVDAPYPYGNKPQKDTVFSELDYPAIQEAVASIFDTGSQKTQKTRAVLVLYKDQIIAEKYSSGLDQHSKLLGWSMTKSILATAYGVLAKQQKINIYDPAPIPEWKHDDRKNITIHNLLQMNSGLEWEEDYSSISDATTMLYLNADMTQLQRHKKAEHLPNTHWNYSSGTSNLLSGILRAQFRSYQEYLDFPYREFIDKIGMHSMLIETDIAGNYVGSSYAWATVRDWAKFGTLYLHNGNWNGTHIFDPSWVDYVTTPAPKSNGVYGAHFWLNASGFYPDAPKDMFSANGYQGQRIFVIPSKDLVIVRFGLIGDAGVDFNTFLSTLVNAVQH